MYTIYKCVHCLEEKKCPTHAYTSSHIPINIPPHVKKKPVSQCYASQTIIDMEERFKLAKVRSMACCGHVKFISLSRTKSDSARSKVTQQNQGHFQRIVNESQYIEVTKPRNTSSPHNQKKKKSLKEKAQKKQSASETFGKKKNDKTT